VEVEDLEEIAEPSGPPEVSEDDEKLLRHIRDRYTSLSDLWREIREERQKDLRYICGDPWDDVDKRARKDAGRPCLSQDELTQYVNQAVNNARQNRRGIKVEPAGNGSSDKTAEFRQNLIRGIEYKSKAQSAYLRAYQDMVEGSYGFIRIGRKYVSDNFDEDAIGPEIFNQEITIGAIMNPDSILYGFDTCKQPDWSDAQDCFVLDPMPKAEFRRRWPDARIQDFAAEHYDIAREWLQGEQVLAAEYWRLETSDGPTVYLLESGEVVTKRPKGGKVRISRKLQMKTPVQYWTNGVEILERSEHPGSQLCIIPFVGLARYVDDGGGSKLKLFSLVRLARDPQMGLAYVVSQQAEEAGLTPKAPYIGYKGQFESDWENWQSATKIPHAMLQADVVIDGTNGQMLPLPQRQQFTPNFAAYEVAIDSKRRAIQAAMGITPLPTAAQRSNEKSGVALERIQDEQAVGSYHYIDSFDRALQFCGRVIESWIPTVYDTERDVSLRKPDDSHQVARINTEAPYLDEKTQQPVHYQVDSQGDHDVTVSTGPSYDSQRREVAETLNSLDANLPALVQCGAVPQPAAPRLMAMSIKMRDLGPKGDEIAEIISPSSPDAMVQQGQQIGQMQMQLQQSGLAIQALQAELQKLQAEKQGKVVDNEYRLSMEKMKIDAQLAIAEVNTKAQLLSERAAFVEDLWKQLHSQAHEAGLQTAEHGHEQEMGAQQAAIAAAQPQQPQAAQ
jgi:hypothetical protein